MDEVDIAGIRRSYELAELREDTASSNPIELLRKWLNDAFRQNVPEPNAMCLCTCLRDRPSARIVLLRGIDDRGLVFYTSYFSRKGKELQLNPYAATVFFWPSLERQVRVEGEVERLSEQESDAYFDSRPRGHQIGAWASEQSEPLESRELLEQRMRDYAARFEGEPVPRPHSWGGLVLRPALLEFWQGRPNRLHDRLEFTLEGAVWTRRRLQP